LQYEKNTKYKHAQIIINFMLLSLTSTYSHPVKQLICNVKKVGSTRTVSSLELTVCHAALIVWHSVKHAYITLKHLSLTTYKCSGLNWLCPALGLQPMGDHYVGKPSTTCQPTRPTQPFILPGSINE